MTSKDHASALLFLIAGVLRGAVERGQHFEVEQSAGTKQTGVAFDKKGQAWPTFEPSSAYKMVLTVEPLPPTK
jgi:hypothetical protein